jgi:hypothetical protein
MLKPFLIVSNLFLQLKDQNIINIQINRKLLDMMYFLFCKIILSNKFMLKNNPYH